MQWLFIKVCIISVNVSDIAKVYKDWRTITFNRGLNPRNKLKMSSRFYITKEGKMIRTLYNVGDGIVVDDDYVVILKGENKELGKYEIILLIDDFPIVELGNFDNALQIPYYEYIIVSNINQAIENVNLDRVIPKRFVKVN